MKKILYFLPFILSSLFYIYIGIIDSFSAINPFIWILLCVLFNSGILMIQNKWWGCLLGILYGVAFILMGFNETGQLINETPFGIIICAYFAYLGFDLYKLNNQS